MSDAARNAEEVILRAASEAKKLMDESEERMGKLMRETLTDVFGANVNSGRFVDTARIPLLCKSVISLTANSDKARDDIDEMKIHLAEIKQQLKPIFWLLAVVGGALVVGLVARFLDMI